MMKVLRPRALFDGATLAIYSPSMPGPSFFPNRLSRALEALAGLGFKVIIPPAAKNIQGFTAGTPEQRASALNQLFEDDTIHGIVCSIGGFNSNEVLPLLDYSMISNHPKIFVGYSDVTALLLAINSRTGLTTFHGPALLPEWGEYPRPQSYTTNNFLAVTKSLEPISYEQPEEWTNEFLDWFKGEDCRARAMVRNDGWKVIVEGTAEGRLMGGNIETLNFLFGTQYCPDYRDSLLFIEATETEAYLPRFRRALIHLRLCGVLGQIRALLVGKCPNAKSENGESLESTLYEVTSDLNIPLVLNLDIGHTDPKLTLPIGIMARLSCENGTVRFGLLEPAVTDSSSTLINGEVQLNDE